MTSIPNDIIFNPYIFNFQNNLHIHVHKYSIFTCVFFLNRLHLYTIIFMNVRLLSLHAEQEYLNMKELFFETEYKCELEFRLMSSIRTSNFTKENVITIFYRAPNDIRVRNLCKCTFHRNVFSLKCSH